MVSRSMLTRDERNTIGHADDSLAGEQLVGHHWNWCKFPFPCHKCDDEENADNQWSKDVGTDPWMGVPSRLKSYQAYFLSITFH